MPAAASGWRPRGRATRSPGSIGGLLARGAEPLTAAVWGVFLHGEAGRRLAQRHGRIGFLARELLEELPRAMNDFSR